MKGKYRNLSLGLMMLLLLAGAMPATAASAKIAVYSDYMSLSDTSSDGLSAYADALQAQGYTVEQIYDPITSSKLDGCEALLMIGLDRYLSGTEKSAIEDFVENQDKGLLLSGGSSGAVNDLAQNFTGGSMEWFGSHIVCDSTDYEVYSKWVKVRTFYDHPVTENLGETIMYKGTNVPVAWVYGGIIGCAYSDDDRWLDEGGDYICDADESCGAQPVLAYSSWDKIVIVPDGNVFDNSDADGDGVVAFYEYDNDVLGLNVARWLARAEEGEIKFTGTAIEYQDASMPGAPWGWTVSVDEMISGPQPCSNQLNVTTAAVAPPCGYMDPDIVEGDKVKVYGYYSEDQSGCGVSLIGSDDYYLEKADECASVVKFKGSASTDESYGEVVCYGSYYCTVKVEEILQDPDNTLVSGNEYQVCYGATQKNIKTGDKLEVFGDYYPTCGPLQYVGNIVADYVEQSGFFIRPACQDEDRTALDNVNYEFIDHSGFSGTTDYNTYIDAPSQGSFQVRFWKDNLQAAATLESHSPKPFAGIVVTLRPGKVHNTDTGKDFSTIQEAIDDPATGYGHTIMVDPGTYHENVNVYTSLAIKSTSGDPENTIIQAADSGEPVFNVTVDYVNLTGFTVSGTFNYAKGGLHLFDARYCDISGNKVTESGIGIYLHGGSHNKITGNNASFNDYQWDQYHQNGIGIHLSKSDNNEITDNVVNSNTYKGIRLHSSSYNKLIHNTASNNRETGIYLGKYLTIDPDSSNNIISNNICLQNDECGIHLLYSFYNQISNNTCKDGLYLASIYMEHSSNNEIVNNTCENSQAGIRLAYDSDDNTIKNNNVSHNDEGFDFHADSTGNRIYLNNFLDNSGYVAGEGNLFNSPEKIRYVYNSNIFENYTGNYWDDYTDVDMDNDGIWDHPYSIYYGEKDYYPLVEGFENYAPTAPLRMIDHDRVLLKGNEYAEVSVYTVKISKDIINVYVELNSIDTTGVETDDTITFGSGFEKGAISIFADETATILWNESKLLSIPNNVVYYGDPNIEKVAEKDGTDGYRRTIYKGGNVTPAFYYKYGIDIPYIELRKTDNSAELVKRVIGYVPYVGALLNIYDLIHHLAETEVYANLLDPFDLEDLELPLTEENYDEIIKIWDSSSSIVGDSNYNTVVMKVPIKIQPDKIHWLSVRGKATPVALCDNMGCKEITFCKDFFINRDNKQYAHPKWTVNPEYIDGSEMKKLIEYGELKIIDEKLIEKEGMSIKFTVMALTAPYDFKTKYLFVETSQYPTEEDEPARTDRRMKHGFVSLVVDERASVEQDKIKTRYLIPPISSKPPLAHLYYTDAYQPIEQAESSKILKDIVSLTLSFCPFKWAKVLGVVFSLSDLDEILKDSPESVIDMYKNEAEMDIYDIHWEEKLPLIGARAHKNVVTVIPIRFYSEEMETVAIRIGVHTLGPINYIYSNTFDLSEISEKRSYEPIGAMILDEDTLIIACPLNATITDQYGRMIADNNTNEIPDADMIIMNDTKIFYLPADLTYSTVIDAYDTGTFNFTRISPIGTKISITKFENIPITADTKAFVEIVPGVTNYAMSVDYNGDGGIDETKYPDVNETIEVEQNSYTIQLCTGWNLISTPLMPEDVGTASVLSPISGNYSIIWEYNASDTADHWKKYDPSAPFGNDLTDMKPGKGYWILMTSDDTLPITGTVSESTDISLTTGWNLIGHDSIDSQPIADALASISDNYDIVWGYNASDTADHWKKYDPSAPFGNDLTDMEPGKGYWILVSPMTM